MIVKFNARGSGSSAGPREYLLGRDGQRPGASLLRGDPSVTSDIIDSSKWSRKYTSGVLSFEEEDIQGPFKDSIMESFEKTVMSGLEPSQYTSYWVEHLDKGRLELNFVIANTELSTGKRLQPYYDRVDRKLVNAWKECTNIQYGLTDPNDPLKQRALCTPSDLPKSIQEAQERITCGLMLMVEQGVIRTREHVLQALREQGFEIARQTKSSISIKNPEGERNIRLKGALYHEDFRFSEDLRGEIEARSRDYQKDRGQRYERFRHILQESGAKKREYNRERFRRHGWQHEVKLPATRYNSLTRELTNRAVPETESRQTHGNREAGVPQQDNQRWPVVGSVSPVACIGDTVTDVVQSKQGPGASSGRGKGTTLCGMQSSGTTEQQDLLRDIEAYERIREAFNRVVVTATAAVRTAVQRIGQSVEYASVTSDRTVETDPRYEAAQRTAYERSHEQRQTHGGPSMFHV